MSGLYFILSKLTLIKLNLSLDFVQILSCWAKLAKLNLIQTSQILMAVEQKVFILNSQKTLVKHTTGFKDE